MTDRAVTTEPTTAPAQKLDLAWPGTHLDRLEWRRSIVAIEAPLQARIAELEAAAEPVPLTLDALDLDLIIGKDGERITTGVAKERIRRWLKAHARPEPSAQEDREPPTEIPLYFPYRDRLR